MRRFVLPVVALAFVGCKKQSDSSVTAAEAQDAVEESALAGSADALTAGDIEVTTDFTIGQGVQKAAQTIADFYRSQAPCAAVSVAGAKVTIDFGATGDGCAWRGCTWHGQRTVEVGRADTGGVQLTHTWTGVTDGRVTVDGEATVDWDRSAGTRHVVHDLKWSGNGRTAEGSGDRTQSLLDASAGLAGGIRIDGTRDWTGPGGKSWHLEIDGVEARPDDPVPQAGEYVLTTPADHTVTLSFARVDADRIRVTLASGRRAFDFVVRRSGAVERG
jgi:hypothetical protein